MKRAVSCLLAVAALSLAGCPDECYQEFGDRDCRFSQSQTRCGTGENLNSVEECQLDSGSGCHLWTESEACDGSLRCDPVEGACVCRNECSHIEGSTCVDNVIYVCEQDSQGCFIETSDDCGGRDLSCQMGAEGRHQCCRSDCQPGQGQCNGRVIEWCLIDETGCAEWTALRDCFPLTCEETDGGVGCGGVTDCGFECLTGETRCAGDTVEHCADDGTGCPQWTLGTDCAVSGETCVSSRQGTWCSGGGCTDLCEPADATRCSGSVIQTCELAGDGCRDWSDGTDCGDSAQVCSDSGGAAACVEPGSCHVINQDCPASRSCNPTNEHIDAGICRELGGATVGEECTLGADCAFALACFVIGEEPGTCWQLCDPAASLCPEPTTCIRIGIGGVPSEWGICSPNREDPCIGGVDEDGDGAVDCADPDCADDPNCIAP